MSAKRKRAASSAQSTPSKRNRADVFREDVQQSDELGQIDGTSTPSKKLKDVNAANPHSPGLQINGVLTPRKSNLKSLDSPRPKRTTNTLETPNTVRFKDVKDSDTPKKSPRADRSARKKAAARVIERSLKVTSSDNDLSDSGDELTRKILDSEDESAGETLRNSSELVLEAEPETPTKRGRGRPKGSKNKRESTPPQADLPPHEQYFWQNRPGAGKTSNNTLPGHLLLNHDEYFKRRQSWADPHQKERDFLNRLHQSAFEQWIFELDEGFNVCLFGYGSKRGIIQALAERIHDESDEKKPPKIIIVNGYNPSLTLRDILTTVAYALFPKSVKLPLQPAALQELILEHLDERANLHPLYLMINTIDAAAIRRPAVQTALAMLASHSKIRLVATADTPNFPLMWDITLRQQYRFVYHDATTFTPFDAAEVDVVQSVSELLGRSGRRVGGKDGVGFVLKSLPENARNLYRILVAEQLAASAHDAELSVTALDDEELDSTNATKTGDGAPSAEGVEYRLLYHKAREELVCSTEHQLRTLLKEFYDHQMVESRRDALGAERLVVPFRREDLENLLEELVV